MSFVNFASNSLPINIGLFITGGIAIWIAGTKLERYSDIIAVRTGLGKAFLGILLLSSATSLPEIATSFTATLSNNIDLAVHNLLGGVVMQTAVLAVADLVSGKRALTGKAPHFALLMAGVGLIFVLATAMVGIAISHVLLDRMTPEAANPLILAWAVGLFAAFLLMLLVTKRSQTTPRWQPKQAEEAPHTMLPVEPQHEEDAKTRHESTARYLALFGVGSLFVLAGGWLVAETGEALAEQTGLGATFVGFTLVSITTSLPEISTTVAAARAKHYETAVSNIFGSNAFDATLLAPVALMAGGSAFLQSLSSSAGFAAALGILMTCIYLWGLLERRDRTVWRLGWDSVAVIVLAVVGNIVIFLLK